MNQPRGLLKLLKLDSLVHTGIDYVETRIDLVKAEAKDNLMKAMRAAVIYGAIAVLGLFFLVFLSITIALVLNAVLDSSFWGFVIVTGIYLILLITLFMLRNSEKVKMMFGDGSVAFLKKDAAKEEERKKKEDEEKRKEDIERVAAIRQKEAEMEHGSIDIEMERRSRSNGNADDRSRPAARPADIKVEKKEDAE